MDLSIIVISHNTKSLLKACLQSLPDAALGLSSELIVVDNGSSDGSAQMVATEFPQARLLLNKNNQGFAKACNYGARKAAGQFCVFVNSDLNLSKESLSKLFAYMQEQRHVAVCAPQLTNTDGSLQNSFDQIPTWKSLWLNKALLRLLFPKRYPSKYYKNPLAADKAFAVPSVIGACFFVRKSCFEKLKGFDEDYFFYLEETDLCLRARREGYEVHLVPFVKVCHLQGQSAKKSPLRSRIEFHRSRSLFLQKHDVYPQGLTRMMMICKLFIQTLSKPFSPSKAKVYWGLMRWYCQKCPDYEGLLYAPLATKSWKLSGLKGQSLASCSEELIAKVLHANPEDPAFQVIKKEPYRLVGKLRIELAEGALDLVIKFYYPLRLGDYLKLLLGLNKAQKEWRQALELRRRKINTPMPVLCAHKMRFGLPKVSLYVMQEVPGATEGLDVLKNLSSMQLLDRRRLISRFAQFIYGMHQAGFEHRDLHLGNVLLGSDGQLYVIDLHRSGFCSDVSMGRRLMNMAYLRAALPFDRISKDALYFFACYAKLEPRLCRPYRRHIQKPWQLLALICPEEKSKLSLQASSMIERMPDNSLPFVELEDQLKLSAKTRVSVCHGQGKTWVIKQAVKGSLYRKKLLQQEWHNTVHLRWLGVPAVRPLSWDPRSGQLALCFLKGAKPFHQFWQNSPLSFRRRLKAIKHLARFVGQLHLKGIYHRDLKTANIMLRPLNNAWRFDLIDNSRVQFGSSVSAKQVWQNLAQIRSSFRHEVLPIEEAVFIKHYSACDPKLKYILQRGQDRIRQMVSQRLNREGQE